MEANHSSTPASHNLESHIPDRPFQFSNIPQGRGTGTGASSNNPTGVPYTNNKAYHTASSYLHRQAVTGGAGTPSSEVQPGYPKSGTMKNEQDTGDPSSQMPTIGAGQAPNSASAATTTTATSANAAGPTATGKGRAGGGASDFVKKLYRMLEEDQYKGIVSWGSKGDSFIVKDMNEFTKTILPSHFKHSNFASFVRQLNKYDFHKVKNPEGQGDAPGENYWEFKHPSFTADQKHSLENIKRKITTNKKPETPNAGTPVPGSGGGGSAGGGSNGSGGGSGGTIGPIDSLGYQQTAEEMQHLNEQVRITMGNQRQIEMHLDRFSAQYQALMADLLGQHRAIAAQDAFTASMLQYMINLECRLLSFSNPGESPQFPPSADAQQLMATYSEISRNRYDKMTETTRRAEQLGLFVNGMRRVTSPSSQQHLGGAQIPGGSQHRPQAQSHLPGHLQQQNTWDGRLGSPDFAPSTSNGMTAQTLYGNEQQSAYGYQSQPYRTHQHPSHLQTHQQHSIPQHQPQTPAQQHSYINQQPTQNPRTQHTPLQHPQAQQAQQQYSYFPSSAQTRLRDGQGDSPSTASESGASFANLAEARISSGQQQQHSGGGDGVTSSNYNSGNIGVQHSQQQFHSHQPQHNQSSNHLSVPTPSGHHHSEPQMDYFPAPGSALISSKPAITPGALMISTLNSGNMYDSREGSQEGPEDGEGDRSAIPEGAGTNALTQQNTNVNKNMSYPLEGEDIAAFAAALKGGQSSMAVRSALTSQPLLVRRATYIPGWSVPPRVLLVEDDAVCRNLTTKFLQLFGCTIDVASDGVEAVNKMQSGVYDICMMDVSMPNLDGVSATSLIRQFDAMTPIISMTGNSRPDEILTYFSHGMNDVLPKPFTKEGMLSMLEKHLIHLKQIHQNPEMLAGLGGAGGDGNPLDQSENLDTDNSDSSYNPFFGLGLSNDEYQNILNGLGKTGFTPSPSPVTNLGAANTTSGNDVVERGNLGKRIQEDDNKDGVKRARFQEL